MATLRHSLTLPITRCLAAFFPPSSLSQNIAGISQNKAVFRVTAERMQIGPQNSEPPHRGNTESTLQHSVEQQIVAQIRWQRSPPY
jgi:hypothetical protein